MYYYITFATCQVIFISCHVVAICFDWDYTNTNKGKRGGQVQPHQLNKYKKLGLNIAYYRKSRGLSQIQLAERINVSRTHMSRIETADCAVSLDVVFAICDVLDVSPAKIFDFHE